jgi:MOSC domain-containing protein YiiM
MRDGEQAGRVVAVSSSPTHGPPKRNRESVRLIAGVGVDGDVHAAATVRHRSRRRRDPELPNLRQVHLIAAELHDELRERGFDVGPGELGENLTTRGVDLLALPRGTRVRCGDRATIELTGLRNPCKQLDGIAPGLMKATLDRDAEGALVRKAGVMAIVLEGGDVRPGDPLSVALPAGSPAPLEPV